MTELEAREHIRKMQEFQKQATSSKESAVAALRAAGILSADGQISDNYPHLKAVSQAQ